MPKEDDAVVSRGVSYREKLLDPRWQKKRLDVMDRDGWRCQRCDDSKKTLHVHHGFYRRDFDPWQYDEDSLWTLCEECHADITDYMSTLRESIGIVDPNFLTRIIGFVDGLRLRDEHEYCVVPLDAEYIYGFAVAFGVSFDDLYDVAMRNSPVTIDANTMRCVGTIRRELV